MDIEEILGQAKLPEKEVPICLRGDLYVELDAAEKALAEIERRALAKDGSLDAGAGRLEAAQRVAQVRQQMLDSSAVFRLRAVPRRRYSDLLGEHPAREGEPRDAATGFNCDTFFDALARESLVDPAVTAEQWEQLADTLSDPQYEELTDAAWAVNRRGVDVPFSSAASRALSLSEPASVRPEHSASAPSGSTAGSPPPPTSTTSKGGSSPRARKPSGTRASRR